MDMGSGMRNLILMNGQQVENFGWALMVVAAVEFFLVALLGQVDDRTRDRWLRNLPSGLRTFLQDPNLAYIIVFTTFATGLLFVLLF